MKNKRWIILLVFVMAGIIIQGCSSRHFVQKDYTGEVSYKTAFLKDYPSGVYFLEFDGEGILSNPEEVLRSIRDIESKRSKIEKIIVLSIGWGYRRSEAYEKYASLLKKYLDSMEEVSSPIGGSNGLNPELTDKQKGVLEKSAVFCISWDSGLLGVRQVVNDVIPSKPLSDTISLIPQAAFPLTFWAKADLAERIGQGNLKMTLEKIIDESYGFRSQKYKIPDIYLIGHSFGARVLNSVISTDNIGNGGKYNYTYGMPFKYMNNIKGVVYILPAILNKYLRTDHNSFPTLIIQSEHDRANNYLFPIANIPFDGKYVLWDWKFHSKTYNYYLDNSDYGFRSKQYSSDEYDHIIHNNGKIADYIRKSMADDTVKLLYNKIKSTETINYVINVEFNKIVNGRALSELCNNDYSSNCISDEYKYLNISGKDSRCINHILLEKEYKFLADNRIPGGLDKCPDRTKINDNILKIGFAIYTDAISLPLSIGSSAVVFGFNYAGAQIWEIFSRNIYYPFDTLAQIPIVKLPIQMLEKLIVLLTGHNPSWGSGHKGLFDFGIFKESATSSVIAPVIKQVNQAVAA